MYKIEQIDWEAVDAMITVQVARVSDMIHSIEELKPRAFDTIKTNIIERTVDSIMDQLYYAFRYEGDMEYNQTRVDTLSAKLRKALESDDVIDHSPIREEIKHMYRVRLLIEKDYIRQRADGIYARLEEIESQTD